jgi:hypothetical protein
MQSCVLKIQVDTDFTGGFDEIAAQINVAIRLVKKDLGAG